MNNYQNIITWVLPVSLVAGGLLTGVFVDKIILAQLRKVAARTKWNGDEIVIAALRGMPILWLGLASLYAALLGLPLTPLLLGFLQKFLLVITILSVTIVAGRIAVGFVILYARRVEGALPSTSIFTNLTRLFAIGLLVVLQSLNISITPILTALGVGGLAVALAQQSTLSNLFSGLQIIASRQVKPGDYIKLDTGEEGYIADITWRNTSIRALPNNMVIVPNSKVASAIVTNYYQPEKELSVPMQVGVGYQSDLQQVEAVTIAVAKEVLREITGGVPAFEPFIRYHSFGASSINFNVILRAREFTDQFLLKHEFVKRLHERYQQEGIEIPFPMRTVYLREEENESQHIGAHSGRRSGDTFVSADHATLGAGGAVRRQVPRD
jgi:small-conductance mechanosensitive channel